MADLTTALRRAYANRQMSAEFDLMGALEQVLGAVGLSVADAGGRVSHIGADPVVGSPLRIGGAATIALSGRLAGPGGHRLRLAPPR
jgi:hypothetical protein